MNPLKRHLRSSVYTMQRFYGVPLELFTPSVRDFDIETGRSEETKARLYVRRALVFDYKEDTNFTYSIQYIRANSNFAQGGFYQLRDRVVAISNRDIGDFEITERSYIVYEDMRYSIVTSQVNEEEGAWIFKVRQVQGQPPLRQISLTLSDTTKVGGEFES